MSPELACVIDRPQRAVAVVRAVGFLNTDTAPILRAATLKALAEQPDRLVIDVAGLTVPDEVALTVFAALSRHADAWPGTPLLLAGAAPDVAGALERMLVSWYVPVYASVQLALAHIERGSSRRVHEHLAISPCAAGLARRRVDEACRSWGVPSLSDRAQLVVTELVSNAFRHAGTDVDLTVSLRRRHLHVAVRDRHAGLPVQGPLHADGIGGRGLLVVGAIATAWGVIPTDDGKVVWATLRAGQDRAA